MDVASNIMYELPVLPFYVHFILQQKLLICGIRPVFGLFAPNGVFKAPTLYLRLTALLQSVLFD